jgi:site-specific recombinase XerD
MKLSTCIQQFLNQYLNHIKGSSEQTIKAYRDTCTLFLPFVAQYHGIKVASLRIDHLTADVIIAFLNHLDLDRHNTIRTRNLRLAGIKSLAKMIRSRYPQKRQLAENILNIPQERLRKHPIGYLYPQEIFEVFNTVDLKKKEGFRDYCLLHLLYDSGARVSEIAALNLDHFDAHNRKLAILGKGNHSRRIELWPKTTELIKIYIAKYRTVPKPLSRHRLFINQRGQAFTRHGIYRLCQKYLKLALELKRIEKINSTHSFRHARAVNLLACGKPISKIQKRLGHENIQSTMVYLQIDLAMIRTEQKKIVEYAQSRLSLDPKIEELIEWENKKDILA